MQRTPLTVADPDRSHHEYRNRNAFAVLKEDGSVVTWGHSGSGGNSSAVRDELQSGVTQIFSSYEAFAALKEDGSVVTWGRSDWGGDSSSVGDKLQSGVTQIFSTGSAFAALKDGSVVTWGNYGAGGNSFAVRDELQSSVTQIFSTGSAFAALKRTALLLRGLNILILVVWRKASIRRQEYLQPLGSFAALKMTGPSLFGERPSAEAEVLAIATDQLRLRIGVTQIFSTRSAFAALKEDGSVVTWGNYLWAGDSSSVYSKLQSGHANLLQSALFAPEG